MALSVCYVLSWGYFTHNFLQSIPVISQSFPLSIIAIAALPMAPVLRSFQISVRAVVIVWVVMVPFADAACTNRSSRHAKEQSSLSTRIFFGLPFYTVLVEIWYLLPILIKFPRGIIVPLFERKISFWFETIPFIYGKCILMLTQEFQERKKN